MSDRRREPYVVEVDHGGCSHCHGGRTWTVVGPDDVAISTSFEDREHVEWIAEQMNHAYQAGQAAARAEGEAAGLEQAAQTIEADAGREGGESQPLPPNPTCPECHGTGDAPNAQFRCPCRWRHLSKAGREGGE
jgi:hypothetical protein